MRKNKTKAEKKKPSKKGKKALNEPGVTGLAPIPKPDGGRSLVPSDPLQKYLSTVRAIPRITEEEERRLAIRVHRDKDHDAALKLVTAHLNVVVAISFEFRYQFQNMLDLIQEGNIGLMRAVEKFDPFRGVRLPTYAGYWIRAYILKYILDNWRLVRVGTTNMRRKLLYNLNRVTHELKASGIDPGPKQLAEHFKTTEAEVEAVQKTLSSSDVSMEAPLSDGSERTYAEIIGEEKPPIEETLGDQQLAELVREQIGEFAKDLKASDKSILFERLMTNEPLTLEVIGEKHNVTREAIRQAETRLKKKLKEYLEEKIPGISSLSFVERR
jgi:RNA polymerase sigma-32 factor